MWWWGWGSTSPRPQPTSGRRWPRWPSPWPRLWDGPPAGRRWRRPCCRLDELYAAFPAERAAWLERYRADCLTLGRTVRLLRAGEEEEAFAEAVDDAFALVVRRADGSREAVSSGEVSVRGLLGYV